VKKLLTSSVEESTLFPRPKKRVMQAGSANMERGLASHRTASCCRGRIWTFTLQGGSEKISFSILLTTTFPVDGADILPLEPEIFQTSPLEKEHFLVR
jgi:hypothetical protein